jgi:hypothetical protein
MIRVNAYLLFVLQLYVCLKQFRIAKGLRNSVLAEWKIPTSNRKEW